MYAEYLVPDACLTLEMTSSISVPVSRLNSVSFVFSILLFWSNKLFKPAKSSQSSTLTFAILSMRSHDQHVNITFDLV